MIHLNENKRGISPFVATSRGSPGTNVAGIFPVMTILRNFSALGLFDINLAKLFRLAPPAVCCKGQSKCKHKIHGKVNIKLMKTYLSLY